MLTLVEPHFAYEFLDRPHLGCAMLIAACQEKGITTTLVKGQTRYLKDMFITDGDEAWDLMCGVSKKDLKNLGIAGYADMVRQNGVRHFKDELKSLYRYVILDKDPRHYFDALTIENFDNTFNFMIKIYFHYLARLQRTDIKIVDRYVAEIIKTNPKYVGFSLFKEFDPLSRAVRKRLKELTRLPIIAGGSLTPFMDLKNLKKLFAQEYFDYLVVGPGEKALPALIDKLNSNKCPEGIPNVLYKKGDSVRGNDLEVIHDLDSLPCPDYSQFDLDLYLTPKRILPLQAGRGCDWRRCAFCAHHSIYRGTYNIRSIPKILEDIRQLKDKHNCSHFAFHDEELPPPLARRISSAIVSGGIDGIYMSAYGRPTKGYNDDGLFRLMHKAGFRAIEWGIESGSQRILDLMNKGTTVTTIGQVLKKSSKHNIANLCFIIFGFPGETTKEAERTIAFLSEHADYIDDINWDVFILQSGAPIGKNPARWNIKIRRGGTYIIKSGVRQIKMNHKKSIEQFSWFQKGLAFNTIGVSSDKLKYAMRGNYRRMLRLLIHSYNFLSTSAVVDRIREGRLDTLFPIVPGKIERRGQKNMLHPVNIKETCLINRCHPEQERELGPAEKMMIDLSNGTLSVRYIIRGLIKNLKKYKRNYIYKVATDFYETMFQKYHIMGFGRSWRDS